MDEAGKKRLLEEYAANKRPETREQLILEYAPLVKVVAGRLSMYLGYNVDYEDLVSYGIFGLIDAIDKFDCLKEVNSRPMPVCVSVEPFWIRFVKWTGYLGRFARDRRRLTLSSRKWNRLRDAAQQMKILLWVWEYPRRNIWTGSRR